MPTFHTGHLDRGLPSGERYFVQRTDCLLSASHMFHCLLMHSRYSARDLLVTEPQPYHAPQPFCLSSASYALVQAHMTERDMHDQSSEHGSVRSRSAGRAGALEQDAVSTDAEEFEAEREAEFREDTRRVIRNLIFMHLEGEMKRQGKDRRQISGVCGQLMRIHAQLSLPLLQARLASRLTAVTREVLDGQIAFLQPRWDRDLLPNDRSFIDALGAPADPTPSRMRQYFGMLLHSGALASGLTTEASQQMQHAVCRYTRGFEYRRFAEFGMRSLSDNGRRQLTVWIADVRLLNQSRHECADLP